MQISHFLSLVTCISCVFRCIKNLYKGRFFFKYTRIWADDIAQTNIFQ